MGMSSGRSLFAATADAQKRLRLLRRLTWLITIAGGFLQASASRFSITPDGNSYLDIASAYLRGDWGHAINAFWSPLFSWLLAFCFGVFKPNSSWDTTVIHMLNFAGLLFSLCTFEFFFRAFLRLQQQWQSGRETEELQPELGWWALGYAVFLSTSLLILSVVNTTPDVWVAVFTYLAVGLLLRIAVNGGGWQLFVAMGFALGCAYLTKSFYFPMSFVFLVTAWLATGNPRKTLRQAAMGLLAFILVAGPWIGLISRAKGRFTFGDAGKLNFAIFHDQIPQFLFWQGGNGTGTPAHPVRQLLATPHLYEFGSPIAGSYPPVFDPSYWMEGVRVRFRPRGLLQVLRQTIGTFFQIWTIQAEFAVAALVLLFLAASSAEWLLVLWRQFFLWVPPLIACFSYAIVLVEFRYVAPFVLLLWVAAFASLLSAKSQLTRRFGLALAFAVLAVTCIRIAKLAVSDLIFAGHQQNVNWQVAERLRSLGAQPGDRVAAVSSLADVHWARLAGIKIVAEIPSSDENLFWAADSAAKQKIFSVFAGTGARFVVTEYAPPGAEAEGWTPLGDTGFYAYRLLPIMPAAGG